MGVVDVNSEGRRHHRKSSWMDKLKVLITAALGAAWGMALNDLSGTLAYRGLAGMLAALGVAGAAIYIRGRHELAPISQLGSWLFLIPAMAAAIAAEVTKGLWPEVLTAGAVVLVAGAVLLVDDLQEAAERLGGVALVGLALTFCRAGAFLLVGWDAAAGIALLLAGLAFAATGLFLPRGREALLGAAAVSLGLAFGGLALVLHAIGHLHASVALAGVGVGVISLGLAFLCKREATRDVAIITAGAVVAGGGVVLLSGQQQAVVGSVVLGLGASLSAIGTACLTGRRAAGYAAVIFTAVLVIASGTAWYSSRQAPLVATIVIGGMAAIMFGAAGTDFSRVMSGIHWLVDPPSKPSQTSRKR
jgi:hypothetical protein